MTTVHGTTVAIDGAGVLLQGPSGCGKSDLALRLIDGGAVLIADDRSELRCVGRRIVASAPGEIGGLLEVRGIGLIRVASEVEAALALAVDLGGVNERLPDRESVEFLGIAIPMLRLSAFEASTPSKVRLAVRVAPTDIVRS